MTGPGVNGAATTGHLVAGPGEMAILDDVRTMRRMVALAGTFFVAGVVLIVVLLAYREFYWAAWLLALLLALLGGGLLAQMLPRYARRATPFLVIRPGGFSCPGLADPLVPWSAVAQVRVSSDPIVCTDFVFEPEAPLPRRDKRRANVQVSRRRHLVSIRGPVPRGMSLESYANLIANALENAGEPEAAAGP